MAGQAGQTSVFAEATTGQVYSESLEPVGAQGPAHCVFRSRKGGQWPVEMKAAGSGFIHGKDLVGQGELFLHERQEGVRAEALGRLRWLAVAHPDDAEVVGVPVHPHLELLDTGLRFSFNERIGFHRHD